MCVIIYKPSGVAMPSESIINACAAANPHGCGFATPHSHYKGFNYDHLKRMLARVPEEDPCIIHFRYATHGSICRANCHPFYSQGVTFAHNGVLDITPRGDLTDSETAFKYIILPSIKKYGFFSKLADININDVRGGSRFALMMGNQVRLFGHFYRDADGVQYSNLNFLYILDPEDKEKFRHGLLWP